MKYLCRPRRGQRMGAKQKFWMVACGALLTVPVSLAFSQQVTVGVTHYAAPSTAEIDRAAFHWKPGARYQDSTAGMPSSTVLLTVPPGEKVCYTIHGANPLLYQYSMTAVDVPVTPSPDLSAIANELKILVTETDKGKAVHELTVSTDEKKRLSDDVDAYRRKVRDLGVTFLAEAADFKPRSDRQQSFATVYAADSVLWSKVVAKNDSADAEYKKFPAPVQEALQDIRALQVFALSELETSHKAIEGAAAVMQPGREALTVCKAMPTGRTRFGLSITARQGLGTLKPARTRSPDKESLASFTIDPEYIERFRVAPGLFVAGLFGQDRDVGVANGKVTIEPTGRTYSRTGMFAMARMTDNIWPTIGVAKADGSSSVDVFAGIQLRAGNFVFGPELSVGVGVAWMDVPVGAGTLKSGDALPDKTKLEDIITRERHFGLGLTFTLSGLTFGKSEKAKDSGDK